IPIPYAIDAQPFLSEPGTAAANTAPLRILAVAKLVDREGVGDVIRACRGIPDLTLTIVGDGPQRDELRHLASYLAVPAAFCGYIPYEDLPNYYHDADVFIHAGIREPWGVSVQEAMAAGLVVLCSEAVGAGELLANSGDPVTFPP